jgi:hypothetical protein
MDPKTKHGNGQRAEPLATDNEEDSIESARVGKRAVITLVGASTADRISLN